MTDLHNHTIYSYDGTNTPEEIIENAIRFGIRTVGICDHQFTIQNKLNQYISHLQYCKEKYADKINVKIGLEIGTRPAPRDLLASSCNGLDYVLFESLDDSRMRAMDLYEFLEWSRLFTCPKGLAHTDIFALGERYGLDMIKIMKEYNLFWELNTSGNYMYYYDFLTNEKKRRLIKDSKLPITIGSDTHDIAQFRIKQLRSANALIEDLGNPVAL